MFRPSPELEDVPAHSNGSTFASIHCFCIPLRSLSSTRARLLLSRTFASPCLLPQPQRRPHQYLPISSLLLIRRQKIFHSARQPSFLRGVLVHRTLSPSPNILRRNLSFRKCNRTYGFVQMLTITGVSPRHLSHNSPSGQFFTPQQNW